MKARIKLVIGCALALITTGVNAATPYGNCTERAQTYQERYEKNMRAGDLVCYQKALERELTEGTPDSCPNSAESYQTAYETKMRSSDLACYQKALERELR